MATAHTTRPSDIEDDFITNSILKSYRRCCSSYCKLSWRLDHPDSWPSFPTAACEGGSSEVQTMTSQLHMSSMARLARERTTTSLSFVFVKDRPGKLMTAMQLSGTGCSDIDPSISWTHMVETGTSRALVASTGACRLSSLLASHWVSCDQ